MGGWEGLKFDSMKIYDNKGQLIIDVKVSDESYRQRTIMESSMLVLHFALDSYVELPLGSFVDFEGQRFWLFDPNNFVKNSNRNYDYTLTLHGVEEFLSIYRFHDTTSKGLTFSLTAPPAEHIKMLVQVLNTYDSGWSVGSVIANKEIVVSYSHNSCIEALQLIAEACETEFEITKDKKIHLGKLSHTLSLAYGPGKGLKSGVQRQNDNEGRQVERLYVQGGTRNIVWANYGSRYLLLPKSQTLVADGETYKTDAKGLYVEKQGVTSAIKQQGSFAADSIYPSREGAVSKVEVVDEANNFYNITDSSIPANLDFSDYQIAGETIKIVFQSGALTGKEFEANYKHSTRTFEIAPKEVDGIIMPCDSFAPAVGDTYAVFGVELPAAYISDDDTQSGASWDLFRASIEYLQNNNSERYSYSAEVSPIWLKDNWESVNAYFRLGAYCHLADKELDDVIIRIRSIKDIVNNPFDIKVDLSNTTVSAGLSTTIGKLGAVIAVTSKNKEIDPRYWLKSELQQAAGYLVYNSEKIKAGHADNANKLDELDSSQFVRSDADDEINGNIAFKKQVSVAGETQLDGKVAINAPLAVSKDVAIKGETQLDGKVNIDAPLSVSENVVVSGETQLDDKVAINAPLTVSKDVAIKGETQLDGKVAINAPLSVAYDAAFQTKAIGNEFKNTSFTAGQFGSGFQLKQNSNGQSSLEIDNILVRREMQVNKLTIAEIKSVGGSILLSLADMVAMSVIEQANSYRVFFNNDNGKIANKFAINDQAICRTWNGSGAKYYWRLVVGIGANYIDLSKTDKDGSSIPNAGDEIIQFGNRTDVKRQQAIILSAYGTDAPSMKQYGGVNSYKLTGKEKTVISPEGNKFTGNFIIESSGKTIVEEIATISGALAQYKVESDSKFAQTSNSITLSVNESKAYTNNAVNAIEVGGVNLLRGSDYVTNKQAWSLIPTVSQENNINYVRQGYTWNLRQNMTGFLEVGKTYTWSGLFRTSVPGSKARIKLGGGNHQIVLMPVAIPTWQWLSVTFSVTSQVDLSSVYFITNGSAQVVDMAQMQIEKGNKATDWSPSPADVQTNIDNVRTETQAKIDVLSDNITLSVSESKAYTNNAVNAIEVGGVNLFHNSETFSGWTNTSGGYISNTVHKGLKVFRASSPWARYVQFFEVKAGETYTLSAYVRVSNYVGKIYAATPNPEFITVAESVEFVRISKTFTCTNSNSSAYACFVIPNGASGVLEICGYKLEKGNKATDWSPSPADVQTNIDKVRTETQAKIDVLSDNITLQVEKTTNVATRKVRYIRDWLNGSNVNAGNHWVEIHAYDKNGNNLARGKGGTQGLNGSNTGATAATDGNLSNYVSAISPLTVDLGSAQEIDHVKVWHYFGDGRTYKDTKTEVSADGKNWFTLFDSGIEGTYKETSAGRTYYVNDYAQQANREKDLVSSLSIDANKISLASKTIELNGTTIAKAIEATSLSLGGGRFTANGQGDVYAELIESRYGFKRSSINLGKLITNDVEDVDFSYSSIEFIMDDYLERINIKEDLKIQNGEQVAVQVTLMYDTDKGNYQIVDFYFQNQLVYSLNGTYGTYLVRLEYIFGKWYFHSKKKLSGDTIATRYIGQYSSTSYYYSINGDLDKCKVEIRNSDRSKVFKLMLAKPRNVDMEHELTLIVDLWNGVTGSYWDVADFNVYSDTYKVLHDGFYAREDSIDSGIVYTLKFQWNGEYWALKSSDHYWK